VKLKARRKQRCHRERYTELNRYAEMANRDARRKERDTVKQTLSNGEIQTRRQGC
jgi:hypothetical protein